MCLDSVKTVKYQDFSEWRFRGNYSSYTNAYAVHLHFTSFFKISPDAIHILKCILVLLKGLQNRPRFSELTFKCWYCSIFSPRSPPDNTVQDTNGMKSWAQIFLLISLQEKIRAFDEWNSFQHSCFVSPLTISCTLLLAKLIILSATRNTILGEDNLQFKTVHKVLSCTKRYMKCLKSYCHIFMLLLILKWWPI